MVSHWMARLEQAARAHDEFGLEAAIERLACASPTRVAAMLLPGMRDPLEELAEAHARAAGALLERVRVGSLWAVDRAARTLERIGLSPTQVERIAGLERGRLGGLALAAMQRDGWARARACELLHASAEPLALCVLVTRTNDPVPDIARQAERSLRAKLDSGRLTQWVAALPLVHTMSETVRAAHSQLPGLLRELLLAHPVQACAELARATRARDPDRRVSAMRTLALHFPAHAQASEALAVGLDDPDPRVRRTVAELLVSRQLPTALAQPLLPRLERDRAAAIRMLGLRWRRKQGDAEALLRACFDRNAGLRHYARRYHRSVAAPADYRALALARLRAGAHHDELVGALATLSDLGRREDLDAVARFAEHTARRVREEAARTLSCLRG